MRLGPYGGRWRQLCERASVACLRNRMQLFRNRHGIRFRECDCQCCFRHDRDGSVAQGRYGQGSGATLNEWCERGFPDGRDRGALDSLVRIFAENSYFNMRRSRQAFFCWSQAALRCGKPWCYSLLRVTLRPGHGRFPAEPGDVPTIQTPETKVWMLGLTPDLEPVGHDAPIAGA